MGRAVPPVTALPCEHHHAQTTNLLDYQTPFGSSKDGYAKSAPMPPEQRTRGPLSVLYGNGHANLLMIALAHTLRFHSSNMF